MKIRPVSIVVIAALGAGMISDYALSQNNGSYGDYYRRNQGTARGKNPGTSRYLYDKYFYHNQAVSPYLSAIRGGSDSGTAYTTSVRPELERREAAKRSQMAYVQQRKRQGNVGNTVYPGANFTGATPANARMKPPQKKPYKPSNYHNSLYGNMYRR